MGRKEVFENYEGFVGKFAPKKTTDDCYTPPAVYDAVVKFVSENIPIEGLSIKRPFKPGGDYEAEIWEYDKSVIVIDNPPFSKISQIVKMYVAHNVKFFLFAPHLTLFSIKARGVSYIVPATHIIYDNGARVYTGFVTNIFPDPVITTSQRLKKLIEDAQNENTRQLPKYKYPANLLTVTTLERIVKNGLEFRVNVSDAFLCRQLDAQRRKSKGIFGNGYLVSDYDAAIIEKHLQAITEKEKTVWKLSDGERSIIKMLNDKRRPDDSGGDTMESSAPVGSQEKLAVCHNCAREFDPLESEAEQNEIFCCNACENGY